MNRRHGGQRPAGIDRTARGGCSIVSRYGVRARLPACETVMVRPLTTSGSVRPNRSGFLSTTTETSVVPAPEVGVTCNHVGAFSTSHRQPFASVTVNLNEPPITGIDTDSRLSFTRQVVAGGSCMTAMTSPPILTEPDLAVEPSFGLTANVLLPDPAKEPVGT